MNKAGFSPAPKYYAYGYIDIVSLLNVSVYEEPAKKNGHKQLHTLHKFGFFTECKLNCFKGYK